MHYDVILAGGGLANGLIAWRLRELRPELAIVCLEQSPSLGGNHTWSFHDQDLSRPQQQWLAPLVVKRWPAYHVHFPQLSRRLDSGYASITSERFAEVISPALGAALRTSCQVQTLGPNHVVLSNGEQLQARVVIDGRGHQASPHRVLGQQAFLGQVLRLRQPHGLVAPILMDARVPQNAGYRFVYVLPFTDDSVLVEDTHYVDKYAPAPEQMRANIADYLSQRGWAAEQVLREEQGVLPITLAGDFPAWWAQQQGQPLAGLRAGMCHCTTGYSLPDAVRLAEWLASQPLDDAAQLSRDLERYLQTRWRSQGFYRLLNRMLFLAGAADQRWQVMQRFYRLPEGLIARFYAGQSHWRDQARILSGKPPVPVGQALNAALRHSPRHFEEQS